MNKYYLKEKWFICTCCKNIYIDSVENFCHTVPISLHSIFNCGISCLLTPSLSKYVLFFFVYKSRMRQNSFVWKVGQTILIHWVSIERENFDFLWGDDFFFVRFLLCIREFDQQVWEMFIAIFFHRAQKRTRKREKLKRVENEKKKVWLHCVCVCICCVDWQAEHTKKITPTLQYQFERVFVCN